MLQEEKSRLLKEVACTEAQRNLASKEWTHHEDEMKQRIDRLTDGQAQLKESLRQAKESLLDVQCDNRVMMEKCVGLENQLRQQGEELSNQKRTVLARDRVIAQMETEMATEKQKSYTMETNLKQASADLNATMWTLESAKSDTSKLKAEIAVLAIDNKKTHARALLAESELEKTIKALNDRIRMEEEKMARRVVLRMKALERRHKTANCSSSTSALPENVTSPGAARTNRKLPDRLPSLPLRRETDKDRKGPHGTSRSSAAHTDDGKVQQTPPKDTDRSTPREETGSTTMGEEERKGECKAS